MDIQIIVYPYIRLVITESDVQVLVLLLRKVKEHPMTPTPVVNRIPQSIFKNKKITLVLISIQYGNSVLLPNIPILHFAELLSLMYALIHTKIKLQVQLVMKMAIQPTLVPNVETRMRILMFPRSATLTK